ncbi:MAG TPA: DinB family protein [Candidatus Eisenbacteria bacterium]|jgi:uncharacterized damage-inducible protein DinB
MGPGARAGEYRRWFDYERDSHARVLAALAAVPPDRRSAPEFQRALTLLAHVVVARRLWLFRLGAAREGPGPGDFFPEDLTLPEVAGRLEAMEAVWTSYLAGLDDAAVARPFEYRTFEGEWFRLPVADILTQLYGHSLYHRGQIALLLRAGGFEPATTDFVFWAREKIEEPRGG